jgi:D-amino-acid oxidase
MTGASPDVCVIGAGVCGLSTALALLRSGLAVTVFSADRPHQTTSAAAGAIWGPHLVGSDDRVGGWGMVTLRWFRELAADPATGVRETRGLAAFLSEQAEVPEVAAALTGVTEADQTALPAGYKCGFRWSAPVIAMPTYLDYLMDQVIGCGGRLVFTSPLRDLTQAAQTITAPVLVNCTGFGARSLVADDALVPVRGQVVVVANPGLTEFFVGEREQEGEITYIFPHGATAVLGGNELIGSTSTRPDKDTAARILRACAEAEPRLDGVPVLAHRVGLRPVRPQVRLESQPLGDGRHVVHNYGHGGSGVTLSWGCAQAVADEVAALLG